MGSVELVGAVQAAEALRHAEEQLRAAEVAGVVALLALCDLHRVDESNLFEGAERWVRGGASGTPLIGEFVAGEVAALVGLSVGSAACRIAQALNLRHRHPRLWNAVLAGRVRVWQACSVAEECSAAGLDVAACGRVDGWCVTALEWQPWPRVRARIGEWIVRADPVAAAARAERAAESRGVEVGRIRDGHVEVWGRVDAADGLALDDALNQLAARLPEHRGDGVVGVERGWRRAKALGLLARHALGQDPLPGGTARPAELVIHLAATTCAGEAAVEPVTVEPVAVIDGWGAVLTSQLGSLLAGCRVTVRPVVVAGALPAGDGHQPTEALRFAVTERNPVDVFPYGTRSARRCDLDHTIPFDHTAAPGAGQTSAGNLGPLSRYTHRLKTHGGWQLTQPEPGVYLWTSPLGYRYLVTAQGTIRLRPPPTAQAA